MRVTSPPEPADRRAHGRQIDHRRYAGEVLEHHAARHEGQLELLAGRLRRPTRQPLDDAVVDEFAAGVAEHVFQQNANGER